jgi:hypothetical protein
LSTGSYDFVTRLLDDGISEILPSSTETILVEELGVIPGLSPFSILIGAIFTTVVLLL